MSEEKIDDFEESSELEEGNPTDDDLTEASRAVALIDQRGYARGRDLRAAVDAWIGPAGGHRPEP